MEQEQYVLSLSISSHMKKPNVRLRLTMSLSGRSSIKCFLRTFLISISVWCSGPSDSTNVRRAPLNALSIGDAEFMQLRNEIMRVAVGSSCFCDSYETYNKESNTMFAISVVMELYNCTCILRHMTQLFQKYLPPEVKLRMYFARLPF